MTSMLFYLTLAWSGWRPDIAWSLCTWSWSIWPKPCKIPKEKKMQLFVIKYLSQHPYGKTGCFNWKAHYQLSITVFPIKYTNLISILTVYCYKSFMSPLRAWCAIVTGWFSKNVLSLIPNAFVCLSIQIPQICDN